jgi:hypothetical protein
MERLTIPDVRVDEHTTRRSVIDVLAVQEHAMEIYHQLKIYEDIAELCGGFDRLRELAEADKDGRVVVLPCKVGETVYFVNAKQILEFAVVGYAVDETGISWVHSEHVDKIGNTNERTFSPDRFGKNTFFTREEAEKALQEMEGKKDGNETNM